MTAFTRELDDLQWYPCRKPGISTALRNMDAKTVKAGNGAAGSTHTVAGLPITIAVPKGWCVLAFGRSTVRFVPALVHTFATMA